MKNFLSKDSSGPHLTEESPCPDFELLRYKEQLHDLARKLENITTERNSCRNANILLKQQVASTREIMRQMVQGFTNVNSSFPIQTELAQSIDRLYKCECLDIYFDYFADLDNIETVTHFFISVFSIANSTVNSHFMAVEERIRRTTLLSSLEGPVMNTLRKAYQPQWEHIYSQIKGKVSFTALSSALDIQFDKSLKGFFLQLVKLFVFCYTTDPPLCLRVQQIGEEVQFNPLLHEALDGFIRSGQFCVVVLPAVHKHSGETVARACVLLPVN